MSDSDDHWIAGAIHHPGALRATARHEGLIHGSEKLSFADLKKLSRSNNTATERRADLAMELKHMHEK